METTYKEDVIYHKSNSSQKSDYDIYLAPYKEQDYDSECFYRGKQVSAHYTDEAVLVYQAFSQEIGQYALKHQNFVGTQLFVQYMDLFQRINRFRMS